MGARLSDRSGSDVCLSRSLVYTACDFYGTMGGGGESYERR